MRQYELMIIFAPLPEESVYEGIMKTYQDLFTEWGISIVAQNPWGLRTLAYPIQKKTVGFYWVLELQAKPELNEKIRVHLSRDERVLRSMLTVLDKHAIAYNERKRNKPTSPEPSEEAVAEAEA